MSNIGPEEIRIEKLSKEHDITGFQSYEKELVKFLKEDALDNQDKRISMTYLWFLKETNELIGYFTLLNDKITLKGNLEQFFKDKNITYSTLPSLKIARLAVDNRFLRKGIGTLMIEYIVRRAKSISIKIAGCRFVTVDAKKNSIPFYLKNEFKIFKEEKDTIFMHLDVTHQILQS
ncbi:MAG: hypothetical protein A2822_01280 [Candidatus Staskawiczbacteria bacterium RIFCSPHIGHO2_01_FULL_41_41]|uniref:N-acetyltransferase domain-containing protein n=1 Tax=Candidatus Staskawiczbacteria bacterium RIFCSPHIGHO2_01_FULL_41_41 TaxID=1802203 RepID=A0A1G2HRC1_9BACT|nr:MAG: hypothetical protein A2822_01280 [Candidatus Staskawiczbacteria bacterium RIFCSPHIGHO2_01_FULL_41_41]HLD80297.1 GNAT family N-acetyltransferase [Candidatus Nanoarchaeia archaeon]